MKVENDILRKLQLSEVIILDEITKICKKNGIRYYLAGGTLLGAVRHNGFIPWDDDLDISMPREDYEKFKKICSAELSEDFELQSIDSEPNFNLFLTKIRLKNTKLVDRTVSGLDINQGIYVDIFPLDYCDGLDSDVEKRAKAFATYAKLKAVKLGIARKKGVKKFLEIALARIVTFFMPISKLNRMAEKVMTEKESGTMYINFCSQYGYKKQTMPREWFGDGCDIVFEGNYYRAPSEYDKVLTNLYSDYMKLPPIEKRKTVHDFIEIDLGKYDEIVMEQMK